MDNLLLMFTLLSAQLTFAGICFAAYDAELGFVSEAYPTRESQSLYGQATVNLNDEK